VIWFMPRLIPAAQGFELVFLGPVAIVTGGAGVWAVLRDVPKAKG
jgi:hypothetical protein